MLTSTRRVVVACATALLFALSAPLAPAAPVPDSGPMLPTPDPDRWYAAPTGIEELKPGDVIKARPMPVPFGFFNVRVSELMFRSTDSEGHPIAATSLVMIPDNHRANGPLLSYQHIINALGLRCTSSRALYSSDPDIQIKEAPTLNVALQQGWAVSLPDHLGPRSAYGAARLGGQIVLDSIRAAQRHAEFKSAHSRVVMAGYSGGGMATAWAAAEAREYAPELNIVGSVEGGVPMNLEKMADVLGLHSFHPAFGLAFAAAIGLEREYPDRLPLTAQLNAEGKPLRAAMNDQCTNGILRLGVGHNAAQLAANTSMADSPAVREVVRENSLEFYPGVPTMPILEWHSPIDVLIPVDSIDRTIRRYCRAGATVDQFSMPVPDHLTAAVLGTPQALQWIADRFAGKPAPNTCHA